MAYVKNTWQDSENTFTSLTADRLNNIEEGIYNLNPSLDGILFGERSCTVGDLVILNFVTNPKIPANSYKDFNFSFEEKLTSVISCAITLGTGSTDTAITSVSAVERELTNTYVTARFYNSSSKERNPWCRVLVIGIK